eukprot:jgi/Chrzof1/9170/Cz03g38170.t1
MDGKRVPSMQTGPAAKRGPMDEFDDLIEEDLDNEMPAQLLPDDLGEADVPLAEAGRNWTRPPVTPLNRATQSLVFQQLEVDYCIGKPRQQMWPTQARQVPIVRMFGVNDAGNSVCVLVHGFEPYFYCECPQHWTPEDCDELAAVLRNHPRVKDKARDLGVPGVTRVTSETRASLWTYQGGAQKTYLKITTALPTLVTPCRCVLEDGVNIGGDHVRLDTYESNVLYALRFMIDTGMGGGSWVTCPAGSYELAGEGQHVSYCQIEAHVRWNSVISHPAEGDWSRIAPLRILSIDIECAGRKGHFPEPQQDPVIQIANMLTVLGESTPRVKNVLTLGSCAAIVGAEVMSFEREADLLRRWQSLVLETDPDVIIGYNITNFDMPYLFERAQALRIDSEAHQWGRIRHSRVRMKDTTFSSKAYGTHEYKDLTIEGRVQFDVYLALQRDHKLSSYSLNAVSAHFLGEQKEDVHHSAITDLQNGNEETRRRLAVYCLKDAYLPQRLLDKLMYMYNHIEMARVTGVPASYLLTRGQSIKVFSQLLRKARSKGFIVPTIKPKGNAGGAGGEAGGVGYEGATVLEPKIGDSWQPTKGVQCM